MFKNKSIFISGGTGSFGQAFVKKILNSENFKDIKKLIIYSRDELKQTNMLHKINKNNLKKVRFYIGDIRDGKRLNRALEGIDIVIHAAALKQVPIAEQNPMEFIKTNVVGAHNLVEACLDNSVENVIALSTDKAVSPINLYGATKLCSDKIFTSANLIKGNKKIKFSVVRYGNVFGSRGSVVPIFLDQVKSKNFTITHKDMTRFNITLDQAIDMVIWTLNNNIGGEIFVPKVSSYKILDLAKAIDPTCKINLMGVRPGEKIYEELISKADSINTYDIKNYFSLVEKTQLKVIEHYDKKKFKKVPLNFEYNSSNNQSFLSIQDLKKLINNFKKNQI
jgi:UDP-N-acetylglucosamine 4,6-dehydratase/5-epimerase